VQVFFALSTIFWDKEILGCLRFSEGKNVIFTFIHIIHYNCYEIKRFACMGFAGCSWTMSLTRDCEFGMRVLEVMRQPLEDKVVTISRARGTLTFPANFQLVAAMNPCPCGYYGDPVKACTCSNSTITRYKKRISGPLLDRIDIHIEVPRVDYEKLSDDRLGEHSDVIQDRVEAARGRQRERFEGSMHGSNERKLEGASHSNPSQALDKSAMHQLNMVCNADMRPAEVRQFCQLDDAGSALIRTAMNQLQLSARAYHRVLKLSRTIADLAGSERIEPNHLAEALQYRPKERMY
jgi:magnesium chelatase family protein